MWKVSFKKKIIVNRRGVVKAHYLLKIARRKQPGLLWYLSSHFVPWQSIIVNLGNPISSKIERQPLRRWLLKYRLLSPHHCLLTSFFEAGKLHFLRCPQCLLTSFFEAVKLFFLPHRCLLTSFFFKQAIYFCSSAIWQKKNFAYFSKHHIINDVLF